MHPSIPPNHVLPRWQPSIVHSNAAVSETGDEDVTRYLVAGHGGEAGVGAGGEVLIVGRSVSERETGKEVEKEDEPGKPSPSSHPTP
jgi:hypothetical protein